jgi:hypothetical protein
VTGHTASLAVHGGSQARQGLAAETSTGDVGVEETRAVLVADRKGRTRVEKRGEVLHHPTPYEEPRSMNSLQVDEVKAEGLPLWGCQEEMAQVEVAVKKARVVKQGCDAGEFMDNRVEISLGLGFDVVVEGHSAGNLLGTEKRAFARPSGSYGLGRGDADSGHEKGVFPLEGPRAPLAMSFEVEYRPIVCKAKPDVLLETLFTHHIAC